MSDLNAKDVQRRTLLLDSARAFPHGVLETIPATFAVLIAIRVFDAGALAKSIIVAALGVGLLLSVFIVPLLRQLRIRETHLAGALSFIGGFSLLAAAAIPGKTAYVLGISAALLSFPLQAPLTSQIFRWNYSGEIRGRLFASVGVLRASIAVGVSYLGGEFLESGGSHSALVYTFAAASLLSGSLIACMPCPPPAKRPAVRPHIFTAFRWVRQDHAFAMLLISWMLMGTGNLAAMSLYVEYFANPAHGLLLAGGTVALLTGVVPHTCRLLTGFFWGWLFDRTDIYTLRIIQNAFCVAAVTTVFCSSGETVFLVIGMACQGIALGGGHVAWNLWVTKIAPAEHVSEYMSVHTFLTGVRRFAVPFAAFPLLIFSGPRVTGLVCAVFIITATAILIPGCLRHHRGQTPARPTH